jgi:hypothetical protein
MNELRGGGSGAIHISILRDADSYFVRGLIPFQYQT